MSELLKIINEHHMQAEYFKYLRERAQWDERYKAFYANHNELRFSSQDTDHRKKMVRIRAWKEGLETGVPDIFGAIPSGEYHGFFAELKMKGKKPKHKQITWLDRLKKNGYYAGWFDNLDELISETDRYVLGSK